MTAENPAINLELAKDFEALKAEGFSGFLQKYDALILQFGIDWGMRLLTAVIIIIAGWMIGNWINRRFERMRRLDGTLKNFLGGLFKYSIMFVAVITVIGLFGIPMASLLAVLGAAGLAIGLALQGTLSNIASGVMLLILRPFNVGDYITWGNEGGTVKSLGLFGTELAMADNVYIFAPNSKIWGNEIRNYSRNMLRRQDITLGISYDDNLGNAVAIINQVLAADERILKEDGKEPQVVTDKMNDYTIDLIVRFWSKNSDYWSLRWDITKTLKEKLEAEGISLPLTPRQMAVSEPEKAST
ncbi:MAG: mechanosensitive ion channel protein MscS [Micavibrio aeruginosavorus]|uniref:Mechanosensitive ion channel protein MscS n=1 Tax=Micavibrio aeruginosavorus TaxID=349221 RepID=A0A2W5A2S7_9BACT|nr:MAG: mechanosensitive ion channel protein MscS [Micavibrio aeruginosavorus]